ncbi:hypothetical protein AQ490_11130 [Wenjunlia vitaminophila]|uniref:Probable membrane transporter protein n=1 Tax=Wenjunlia vitaminophila TaxID=76728 RepID=A0A0T6LKP0_WENVI|nr:TSUP family transporter [Wenjunlia vitaminophila]KRV46449.1 hypothetical protein AQ490_11130 [Wenjunlia vitaminophila]
MDVEVIAALLCVAFAAGWVDAVVGGGGLIQFPALLLALPNAPIATALGTNKLVAITGTTAAAVSYARRTSVDWRTVGRAAALAVPCSAAGALIASELPADVFRPAIMVVLLGVALFVTLRPAFGRSAREGTASRGRLYAAAALAGGGIGFYDGVLGAGTGTFLIITFVALLGADFVGGSAMAKWVNLGTNAGALLVFAVQGHVLWLLGLGMACCNVAGGTVGARVALSRGAGFVRGVLLVVVLLILVKLGHDQWG